MAIFDDIPTRNNGEEVDVSWWNTIKTKLQQAFPNTLTANKALETDGSGNPSASAVTSTELGYVSGVTSAIQTQLTARTEKATLTTKGDIYAATASATPARLGVGTNDQVLTADSSTATGLAWKTPSASALPSVSTKTSAYTLTTSDDYIIADASSAAFTLTLPTAVGNTGKAFLIKKIDATVNAVTVDGNASETIDGATTQVINGRYGSLNIVSDGSNWIIVTENQIHSFSDTVLGFTLSPSVTIKLQKIDNQVFVKIPSLPTFYTKSGAGPVTIATLPVGFRPIQNFVFPFNSRIGGTYGFNGLLIDTSGAMLLYSGPERANIPDSTATCGWDVAFSFCFDIT